MIKICNSCKMQHKMYDLFIVYNSYNHKKGAHSKVYVCINCRINNYEYWQSTHQYIHEIIDERLYFNEKGVAI